MTVTTTAPAPNPLAEGGWYAAVRNGKQRGLLVGPFPTRADAEPWVDKAQDRAREVDAWAHFYTWGVAYVRNDPGLPSGRFNTHFGLAL